jgi:23S rRNA maturation-related 3'-5' exoribonuclease YhaM
MRRFWQSNKIELSRTEIERLIDEWIFSERDRMILKRRLLDGICYEPLAEEFNLSVRQIKNIVYKCEDRLFSHI